MSLGVSAQVTHLAKRAGRSLIHPLRAERGAALLKALHALSEVDEAFIAALVSEQAAVLPLQECEAL